MEIVSEPDMRSPEEARHYLTTLHTILQYVGVSTANLQDGSFRCDANISIRPRGSAELMSRVEVKNMNSFRAVYNALQYEVDRQVRLVDDGGKVAQETRGWSEERNATVPQRSKEYAHDYRTTSPSPTCRLWCSIPRGSRGCGPDCPSCHRRDGPESWNNTDSPFTMRTGSLARGPWRISSRLPWT